MFSHIHAFALARGPSWAGPGFSEPGPASPTRALLGSQTLLWSCGMSELMTDSWDAIKSNIK